VCAELLASKHNAQVFFFKLFRTERSGVSVGSHVLVLRSDRFGRQVIVTAFEEEGRSAEGMAPAGAVSLLLDCQTPN
jgi:hypothetical protein